MIQELNPGHNIDQFTYEHMLSDNEWLSDCNWIYDKSKSESVEQIFIVALSYIQYISHIQIKQWRWSMCLNLISISSNDDYRCVYISYLNQAIMIISLCLLVSSLYISYPYQAMMMINVSTVHLHIKQCVYNFLFLTLNPMIYVIYELPNVIKNTVPHNRDDFKIGEMREIILT